MPSPSGDLTADGTLTETCITRASRQYDVEVVCTLTLRGVGLCALGTAFTRCLALTHVDIMQNKLQSLKGIALLGNTLRYLNAAENQLEDVSGIDACLLLENVQLEGNQLSSEAALAPLGELPCLRWLVLQREVHVDGMNEPLLLDNPVCRDKKVYENIMRKRFSAVLCIDGQFLHRFSSADIVSTAVSQLPSISVLRNELQELKYGDEDNVDERIFANVVSECRLACQKALSSPKSTMAGVDRAEVRVSNDRIALGDYVILTGGGIKRMVVVQSDNRLRLGSTGTVQLDKLAGLRFGEVLRYDPKSRVFVPTNEYPDLDITHLPQTVEEVRDNRHLVDDNRNQILSKEEIAAMRVEKGVDQLITSLAEKSTTFHTKTAYSQEKYLRKKKKRHGTLYKVERVTPDGLAEIHLPTINPSDVEPEETRWMRLRADTLALILHHSDVHSGSRVLVYDKTNGYLEAALLARLGGEGMVLQLMDRVAQPNVFPAQAMGISRIREMWKAIPRNADFLLGVETVEDEEKVAEKNKKRNCDNGNISQWLRGIDAHNMLKERPADSLIIIDDEGVEDALNDLLPFLALCGHVVVFSPFLEDLTALFTKLRGQCVNICISETWYRHHQLLPNRTHPTVNMSTAGGYVLTAIKVEVNGGGGNSNVNSSTNAQVDHVEKLVPQPALTDDKGENGQTSRKRVREDEEGEEEEMMAEAME